MMGLTPTRANAQANMKDATVNTESTHARIIRVNMVPNAENAVENAVETVAINTSASAHWDTKGQHVR